MELISKQEIIDRLDNVIENGALDSNGFHPLSAEAVREMVEQLPLANNSEIPNSSDTISRAKAIEALNREYCCGAVIDHCGLEAAMDIISELPPAGPQIIRCKDCKYREYYRESDYMCALDTGDPYMTARNAEDDDWFCADAERKDDE